MGSKPPLPRQPIQAVVPSSFIISMASTAVPAVFTHCFKVAFTAPHWSVCWLPAFGTGVTHLTVQHGCVSSVTVADCDAPLLTTLGGRLFLGLIGRYLFLHATRTARSYINGGVGLPLPANRGWGPPFTQSGGHAPIN